MKVTVLLPVFNAGPALVAAIDSILYQNFPDFEFLIIDDVSQDRSRTIIRRYEKKDGRIRAIFHDKNQGLARTLNEGLTLAASDLIARMDQDDEALPDRLGKQYEFMLQHPEVAVLGSYVFHKGINTPRDRLIELPVSPDEIARTLPSRNCLYHPSVMMRRPEILSLGGFRPQFKNAEDYDLWLRVSRRYRIANFPEPLLRYNFTVSGMTLSRKWEQLYYVYLAQAFHRNETDSVSLSEDEARKELEKTDRKSFLECVAKGTAEELKRLGFKKKMLQVLWVFSRDIGRRRSYEIARDLLRPKGPDGKRKWALK
jgi:glycosyltransferase involved in cell wall biosynthesis